MPIFKTIKTLSQLVKLMLKITGFVFLQANVCFESDGTQSLSFWGRLTKRESHRCPICGRKCPTWDAPHQRAWRTPDMGGQRTYIQAEICRVKCPEHGVIVERVPWARHKSRFTREFEDQVAWLAIKSSRMAVAELMRVEWRSVGDILQRVRKDLEAKRIGNRFDGLVRIGIDETSYKKGHKYMWVVVNHDTGKMIWCRKGNKQEDLEEFFRLLTPEQCASIQLVSADGLRWLPDLLAQYCPNAKRCIDTYHACSWVNEVLDEVRKGLWRDAQARFDEAKKSGDDDIRDLAKADKKRLAELKYALLKNPSKGKLTNKQAIDLSILVHSDPIMWEAYNLKEEFRLIFKREPTDAIEALDIWIDRARICNLPGFADLAAKIERNKQGIIHTINYQLTNGRTEAINMHIKRIIRMGYGFSNFDNLESLLLLQLGDLPSPKLPR